MMTKFTVHVRPISSRAIHNWENGEKWMRTSCSDSTLSVDHPSNKEWKWRLLLKNFGLVPDESPREKITSAQHSQRFVVSSRTLSMRLCKRKTLIFRLVLPNSPMTENRCKVAFFSSSSSLGGQKSRLDWSQLFFYTSMPLSDVTWKVCHGIHAEHDQMCMHDRAHIRHRGPVGGRRNEDKEKIWGDEAWRFS